MPPLLPPLRAISLSDRFTAVAHSGRRWRTIGPSSFGLAFNLLALYISSWVYLVTNVLSVKAYLLQSILESPGALYGIGNSNAERNGIEDKLMHYYSIAQCAGTATLTLNVSVTTTTLSCVYCTGVLC